MSKVESFYWNKLSNESFCFESEQLLICVFLAVQEGCIDSIWHKLLPYSKTEGIFQEK